jgi:hypothetical protein
MRAPLRMPSFAPPTDSVLAHAIWHVGQQTTVVDSVRIENAVLRDRTWTLAERDLIRLAAISRRHHLAYRNDCCTVTERTRKGRPRPAQ